MAISPCVAILALALNPARSWAQEPRELRFSRVSARSEDRLRVWIQKPAVRAKISLAESRAADLVAANPPLPRFEIADYDLKDAVADTPSRPDLSRLPGLKAPKDVGCPAFERCVHPPLALDLDDGEPIEPAARAMLRPWLWLQRARGKGISFSAAKPGDESRLLEMNIPDVALRGIGLNVVTRPEGGYHLWFDRGLELAAIYAQGREAVKAR